MTLKRFKQASRKAKQSKPGIASARGKKNKPQALAEIDDNMSQGDLNEPFLQRVSSDGAALLPLSDDSSKRTAVASSIADNEADAAAGGGGAVGNNNSYASPSDSYGSPSESKISAFVLADLLFFSAAGRKAYS